MASRVPVSGAIPIGTLGDMVTLKDRMPALSRQRALLALRRHPGKEARDIFQGLIADSREPARLKHLAVMGLCHAARDRDERRQVAALLKESARHVPGDRRTLCSIATALGRVGTQEDLEELNKIKDNVFGAGWQKQIDFAAALLAYRERASGHEIVSKDVRRLAVPSGVGTRRMQLSALGQSEAKACLMSVAEALGGDFSEQKAHQLQCGDNTFAQFWNGAVVGSKLSEIAGKKTLLGVLTRKSRFDNSYALSSYVLATPTGSNLELSVHRAKSGEVVYVGSMKVEGGLGRFELQAADRPGMSAVNIAGVIDDWELKLDTAESAAVAVERRVPTRDA